MRLSWKMIPSSGYVPEQKNILKPARPSGLAGFFMSDVCDAGVSRKFMCHQFVTCGRD